MQQERLAFLANTMVWTIEKEGLQPSFNYINTSGMIKQVTDILYKQRKQTRPTQIKI